jgi:hypothetical protein
MSITRKLTQSFVLSSLLFASFIPPAISTQQPSTKLTSSQQVNRLFNTKKFTFNLITNQAGKSDSQGDIDITRNLYENYSHL